MADLAEFPNVFANGVGNIPDADQMMEDLQHLRTYVNTALDADNITAGTLSGDRLEDGAVSTAKVEDDAITPAKLSFVTTSLALAASTGLAASFGDLSGMTYTAPSDGTFLVMAHIDCQITFGSGAGVDAAIVTQLLANGVAQTAQAVFEAGSNGSTIVAGNHRGTVGQTWIVTVSSGQVLKLQSKATVSGSPTLYQVNGTHTTMRIVQIG